MSADDPWESQVSDGQVRGPCLWSTQGASPDLPGLEIRTLRQDTGNPTGLATCFQHEATAGCRSTGSRDTGVVIYGAEPQRLARRFLGSEGV